MTSPSVSPDEIKAGKYELVADEWDEPTNKPNEPFTFTRHRKGDIVQLNAEEARRLVLAGAAVKPGERERSVAEVLRAQADAAQQAYEDALRKAAPDPLPSVPPAGGSADSEPAPRTMAAGDDPGGFKVEEVQVYLASADETERARVLDAEAAGKNRTSIIGT